MPIGYLITIVVIGVCTIAASIQARRFGIPIFYFSLVINEIPHLTVLFLVLSIALAMSEGDCTAPAASPCSSSRHSNSWVCSN